MTTLPFLKQGQPGTGGLMAQNPALQAKLGQFIQQRYPGFQGAPAPQGMLPQIPTGPGMPGAAGTPRPMPGALLPALMQRFPQMQQAGMPGGSLAALMQRFPLRQIGNLRNRFPGPGA